MKQIFLLLLPLVILLFGCEVKQDRLPAPKYNTHILGYTSGSIRTTDPVVIRFVQSEALQQTDPSELIRIQPEQTGTATWTDAQTFTFYPEEAWTAGETYRVIIPLDRIRGLSGKNEAFEFSFDVMPKTLKIVDVQRQSNKELSHMTIIGTLELSDEMSGDLVEKATRVMDGQSSLDIRWEHHSTMGRHIFKIQGVPRKEEQRSIRILVDGSKMDMPHDLEYSTVIPAMGSFELTSVKVNSGKDQSLELAFSEPLEPNQEIDGLIEVEPTFQFKLVFDDDVLKLYPTERLEGEYTITVYSHLRNVLNRQLDGNEVRNIDFAREKPQVKLISDGVIVPNSQGLTFPFKAVNVKAVRLRIVQILEDNMTAFLQKNNLDGQDEIKRAGRLVYKDVLPLKTKSPTDLMSWNHYKFNLEDFIQVEKGAMYRIYLSLERPFSLFDCATSETKDALAVEEEWSKEINESDEDLWDYYGYRPKLNWREYRYRERDDPCKPSYYMSDEATVSCNILASDLGLLAKSGGENKLHVVVSDILSAKARSGVDIKVYTFQKTLIGRGKTNEQGIAQLEISGKPFLLVAEKGNDRGYLRIDDGSAESVSMFEVDGVESQKGLKGMIYGERGVWRPGDSIFLQFILQDKSGKLPDDHPIIFEWYNPRQQMVHRKVGTVHESPFYDYRLKTNLEDPTGIWRGVIKIGNSTFEKNIRVETVKPNRLRMNIDFGSEVVSAVDGSITGQFQSDWLHGAPASGLEADVKLKLASNATVFSTYPNYRFDNASLDFQMGEVSVFEGALDENGRQNLKIDLNLNRAPGILTGQFTNRVYERGGSFSIDRQTVQISPYKRYVGIKVPKGSGWRGAIQKSDSKVASLVLLDEDGQPLSGQVEVLIYGLTWRWWYDHNYGRNLSNFMRSKENQLLRSDVVQVNNGKAFYDLPELNGYMSYVIIVKDNHGGHSASSGFRFGWNAGSEDKVSSKMLPFKFDKEVYQVEEEISIAIPSNGSGEFIVSLESAHEVVELKRVKAQNQQTIVKFHADAALAPNAYVYVAYLQPHAQTKTDLPIRLYGVQPVFIEDNRTQLSPELKISGDWEPEKEVEIQIAEASGKSMEYTLAIVDEGLLQLTRYQTPDARNYFYQKEALAVRTWDLYDLVVGAHAGEMAALLAVGGDGQVLEAAESKANRFPPVVNFLGQFTLNKGERKTHKITLPNYVGQVRVMVVAADKHEAYGHVEESVVVKKPLMILASLPRVLGPSESAGLPVTIFSMDPKIKEVKLSVKSGDLVEFPEDQKTIRFNNMGEQVVYFPLEVSNRVGVEKIEIVTEGHGYRAKQEIEIDIRPSNPMIHLSESYVVEPGNSIQIPVEVFGIEGTNAASLNVAKGISVNFDDKAQRLFGYPHGCIEQTTSRVFPQLYALQLMELEKEQINEIENNIQAGIDRIYSFQLANGGIGYWPNAQTANAWGSNYAGHFMLEAASLGYALPPRFLPKWIKYQSTMANNYLPDSYGRNDHGYYWSGDLIQAYRLYTLALAGSPQIGAMNRLRGRTNLSPAAKWRLALAYQIIGRDEVAQVMVANVASIIQPYKDHGTTFGSALRDQSMILETQIAMEKWGDAQLLAKKIVETWKSEKWLSTQSTAYVMIGLFKYMQYQEDKKMNFVYSIDGNKEVAIVDNHQIYTHEWAQTTEKNQLVEFTNKGEERLYIDLQRSGVPLEGIEKKQSSNLEMQVKYNTLYGGVVDPQLLPRGSDFIAEVTVKNPGKYGDYSEMALTQIFPSGWEIHNRRLDHVSSEEEIEIQYQDIRDDRVYTYFDLPAGKSKSFKIQLTATYPGSYYMPSVYCEAMYDNKVYAVEPGRRVEVDYRVSGMAHIESE